MLENVSLLIPNQSTALDRRVQRRLHDQIRLVETRPGGGYSYDSMQNIEGAHKLI